MKEFVVHRSLFIEDSEKVKAKWFDKLTTGLLTTGRSL